MNNKRLWIGMLSMMLFLFPLTTCQPPDEVGDVLIVNQYHESIHTVIINSSIRKFKITAGESRIFTPTLGKKDIYVITNDNKVSNSVEIAVHKFKIETITLNEDGTLEIKWEINLEFIWKKFFTCSIFW